MINSFRMQTAIKNCQAVIQQSAYYLLAKPSNMEETHNIYFGDVWRRYNEIPSKITITFDYLSPSRKIVLYNSLPFTRHEVLTVFVSSPHVEVSALYYVRRYSTFFNLKHTCMSTGESLLSSN